MKIVDVTGTHAHRFGKLVAIMAPKPAVDIKRRFQTASLKQCNTSSVCVHTAAPGTRTFKIITTAVVLNLLSRYEI